MKTNNSLHVSRGVINFILLAGLIICVFLALPACWGQDYEPHKLNTDFTLVISSNNATSCNATYIQFPDNTQRLLNIEMTKSGTTFYTTINYLNFTNLGVTCMGISCTDGNTAETGSVCKDVTYNGTIITTEQSYIYIVALVFIVLLMFGLVFISHTLPSNDATDEEGTIVQVSMLKHLRPVLWIIIWSLGLTCLFIISNLGLAFLPNAMIGNLFFTIYRIMFWLTIVSIPLYFIWIFYKIFKDKEMKRLIERGVEFRGTP